MSWEEAVGKAVQELVDNPRMNLQLSAEINSMRF